MRTLFTSIFLIGCVILNAQIPEALIGNWINEKTNEWEYGFFEEFAIYKNDFWQYESIKLKGNKTTLMLDKMTNLFNASIDTIDYINKSKWFLSLNLIPLCIMPYKYIAEMINQEYQNITQFYTDPNSSFEFQKRYNNKKCEYCVLHNYCDKFTDEYLNYYGDSEINAYTIDDIKKYEQKRE